MIVTITVIVPLITVVPVVAVTVPMREDDTAAQQRGRKNRQQSGFPVRHVVLLLCLRSGDHVSRIV